MEFLELVVEYLNPGLTIVLIFVMALGLILKLYPTFKAEWLIPTIQWVVAIVFAFAWLVRFLDTGLVLVDAVLIAIVQGTLIACIAVFGYQQVKQLLVKRKEDK